MIQFMSGLPRSGSTLLSSILNQNPDIHSGPASPMSGMMFNLEQSIIASEQYRACPKPQVMSPVVTGILKDWYSDRTEPLILDKSREWPIRHHFEMLVRNLPYDPKVIVVVRTVTDILASFIALVHRNEGQPSVIDREIEALQEFNFYRPPDDTRCDHLMRPKGLIDNCLYGLAFALHPDNRHHFHIVEYEALVGSPSETVDAVYDFLELPHFDHDFANIVNTTPEDDRVHGLMGMHDVRPTISPSQTNAREILSEYAYSKYSGLEFWRGEK